MRPYTDEEIEQIKNGEYSRVSFRELVHRLGGFNEVYDAILDDSIEPPLIRLYANEIVDRQEIRARANYRLARAMERPCH